MLRITIALLTGISVVVALLTFHLSHEIFETTMLVLMMLFELMLFGLLTFVPSRFGALPRRTRTLVYVGSILFAILLATMALGARGFFTRPIEDYKPGYEPK